MGKYLQTTGDIQAGKFMSFGGQLSVPSATSSVIVLAADLPKGLYQCSLSMDALSEHSNITIIRKSDNGMTATGIALFSSGAQGGNMDIEPSSGDLVIANFTGAVRLFNWGVIRLA